MKTKDTAFDTIKSILLKKKVIDNYYVIDKRITTRISDVIFKLRNQGWNIETVMGRDIPKCPRKNIKNCYYKLIEK